MPFFPEPDGTAVEIHWNTPEFDQRCQAPAPASTFYISLAGCCRDHGVQASAFEHPVTVDLLYDGREVIANDWKTTGLALVDKQAIYRITFFDGVLYPGGKHISELVKERA